MTIFHIKGENMKKYVVISILLMTPTIYAISDAQAREKSNDIFQVLVGAHTSAFGHSNLLRFSLDLTAWNQAIAEIKDFVTTVIDEHTNFFGMRDSTLVNALDKVTKAEIGLVNTIKISRGLLKSPSELVKQIEILTRIINDMRAVQNTLTMRSSSVAKNEAQKILKNTALFIEVTAEKARKDANAAYNPSAPTDLPPVYF